MSEEGFEPVIKAIRKWDKEVRNELRKELRAAGEIVATEARGLAGSHSKTIPGTIKTRTRIQSRYAEVEIKAGSAQVPIAGLFELGNKGGSKSKAATGRGKFRHPVFGDKTNWVAQDMHPYLAPAIEKHLGTVTKSVGSAVDAANITIEL